MQVETKLDKKKGKVKEIPKDSPRKEMLMEAMVI
jgi:hypothetical protein